MADLRLACDGAAPEHSSQTRYRTLRIDYPAIHLIDHRSLPEGTQLHLYPPKDCTYREKPRLGSYHLTADNLSFYHRIPVRPTSESQTGSEDMSDLLTAVQVVGESPGEAYFEGVSYYASDGEVQHIFCLADIDDLGYKIEHYWFELSDPDLKSLFAMRDVPNDHPWLDLLYDLFHRCSDRAYLHVQSHLNFHGHDLASKQDALWDSLWDTEGSNFGHEMFIAELRCRLGDGSTAALNDLNTRDLAANAEQNFMALLPCGCAGFYSYAQLLSLTDDYCLNAECGMCGSAVLRRPEHIKALTYRVDRAARDSFEWAEIESIALDGPVLETGSLIDASVQKVCLALEATLNGFEVPASANPTALALHGMPETRVVLRALQQEIQSAGGVTGATPASLLHDLEAVSMRTLDGFPKDGLDNTMESSLPPGLLVFVRTWLRRTVNYLSGVQPAVTEDEVEELTAQFDGVQMSQTWN